MRKSLLDILVDPVSKSELTLAVTDGQETAFGASDIQFLVAGEAFGECSWPHNVTVGVRRAAEDGAVTLNGAAVRDVLDAQTKLFCLHG